MDEPQQSRPASGSPDTLAERLRKGREAKGVSAEVASAQSSVPIRYVRMFEEGEYPVVADPAYLAHFVRRYAAYLGLDAETASRDLIAETEPETALRRAGKTAAPKRDGKPASPPLLSVEPTIGGKPVASDGRKLPTLRGAGGRRKSGTDSLPLLVVGVVVTGVVFGAFHVWSKRVTSTGAEQVAASPTAALPAAEPTLAPAVEPAVESTQVAPPTALPTQPVVIATAVPPPATVATAPPRPAPTAAVVPTHPPASPRPPAPPPSPAKVAERPARSPASPPPARPTRRRSADEEASDALRAEQLERLKQRTAQPAAATPPPQQP